MQKNNNEFNPEKILDDLCLASPVSKSSMFYVRYKANKEAEEILIEEGVSKKDAKKLVEYLYKKYCSEIELVPIKIEDIDRNDVLKLDDDDVSNVTTYLVKFGDILQQSPLCETSRPKGGLVFYLTGHPVLPLEKAEQLWKIVRKTNN
jgi:hypothetical protein